MAAFSVNGPTSSLAVIVAESPHAPSVLKRRIFVVSALETPDLPKSMTAKKPTGPGVIAAVQHTYENHSHLVIGQYPTWKRARAVGEAYARRWLAEAVRSARAMQNAACSCGPIGKRRKAAA